MLAGAAFVVMVTLAKLAREQLSGLELVFWRGLLGIPLALYWTRRVGLAVDRWALLGLRIALGFGAMMCYFVSIRGLPVAESSFLSKLQPVFVAVLAPFVLGATERLSRAVWVALALGVAGMAVIVTPCVAVGSYWGVIALCGAILSAGAHLCVKALNRTVHFSVIVFYFQTGAMVIALAAMAVTHTPLTMVPLQLWPHLAGIAAFATAGQLLMTKAYSVDKAGVVAASSYTATGFAVVADLAVFGLAPSVYMLVGGTLIIVGGIALIRMR